MIRPVLIAGVLLAAFVACRGDDLVAPAGPEVMRPLFQEQAPGCDGPQWWCDELLRSIDAALYNSNPWCAFYGAQAYARYMDPHNLSNAFKYSSSRWFVPRPDDGEEHEWSPPVRTGWSSMDPTPTMIEVVANEMQADGWSSATAMASAQVYCGGSTGV